MGQSGRGGQAQPPSLGWGRVDGGQRSGRGLEWKREGILNAGHRPGEAGQLAGRRCPAWSLGNTIALVGPKLEERTIIEGLSALHQASAVWDHRSEVIA